jgi:hypothetical protein
LIHLPINERAQRAPGENLEAAMLTKKINDNWYIVRCKRLTFFGTKREIVEARCMAYFRANPQYLQQGAK